MSDLQGKVAVVIGSSRGIGAASVRMRAWPARMSPMGWRAFISAPDGAQGTGRYTVSSTKRADELSAKADFLVEDGWV